MAREQGDIQAADQRRTWHLRKAWVARLCERLVQPPSPAPKVAHYLSAPCLCLPGHQLQVVVVVVAAAAQLLRRALSLL